MNPRVVIVGMPASGKTTVGRHVAERLGEEFVDADTVIELTTGKLIREIFADHGEAEFRRIEEDVVLAALAGGGVVSLGGGAVLSPRIRESLADHTVVWLDVNVATATRRAGMNQLRPLLLGDVRSRLEALMAERRPLYEEVATHRVSTSRVTSVQVADRVVALICGGEQS